MTVSELISELEEFKREHGDLPVVVYHYDCVGWDGWEEFRSKELELRFDETPRHTREYLEKHWYPGDSRIPEDDIPDGPYLTLLPIDE